MIPKDDQILLCREWFDVHGEPPKAWQWDPGEIRRRLDRGQLTLMQHRVALANFENSGCPTISEVRRAFGTFGGLLLQAGLYPRVAGKSWNAAEPAFRSYWLREGVRALKAKESVST